MLFQKFGLDIPSYTLYRAKNYALKISIENNKDQHYKLHRYRYAVKERNLSSIISARIDRASGNLLKPPHLIGFFLSSHAQKMGYLKGYHPFIYVDGCNLSGPYEWVLLGVVSVYATNGIFSLTIVIIGKENSVNRS